MLSNFSLKYLSLFFLALILALFVGYFAWTNISSSVSNSQESTELGENILPGKYYQTLVLSSEINSEINDHNSLSAEYKVWIPEGIDRVRGIIVKQHGCGADAARSGLDHATDLQWQTLAAKHQFALMGTKLLTKEKICERWFITNYASKATLLTALDSIAEQSGRTELKEAPWVLWGHSGGAEWAPQILQEYPERTIALVGSRGGGLVVSGTNPQLINIPVLFSLGENDNVLRDITFELPQKVFRRYRQLGALWSIAIEANTAHETGNGRLLAIPYMDAVITARLDKNSNKLHPIDKNKGWLADNTTHEIALIENFGGDPLDASWLPNKEVAQKWQQLVTTGKILPTRKPNAPTDVKATKISPKEVLIEWNFNPDLENGLPSFHIYRNNSLIHTIKGQEQSFGDTSKTALVALEFRDRKAIPNSNYTVTAFNCGLD